MLAVALSLFSAIFYLAATAMIGARLATTVATEPDKAVRQWRIPAAVGCGIGAFLLLNTMLANGGLRISIASSAALICWSMATLLTVLSLRNRIDNLGLVLLPLAATSGVVVALLPPSPAPPIEGGGLQIHIVISLLAYSLLSIAAVQAAFLAWQERHLRSHRHGARLFSALPPMQTMEIWLFQLIGIGFLFLSASLATGMLFVDDLLGQHLIHKLVFSVAAWLVFATLLWGRWRHGWRGKRAIRWTLAGCLLLALAYFGSKWVLEILLKQHWG